MRWGDAWNGVPLAPGARIWIVGASGQVGQACMRCWRDRYEVRGFVRTEWDITRPEDVSRWILDTSPLHRPDCIVNCAAMTRVDACETHPEDAERANAHGPGLLAYACERTGILLVHLSTDYVFSGTQETPLQEDTPPHPCNVYGRTKLEGERRIVQQITSGRFLIVRTSWVFSLYRANFLTWVLERARAQQQIPVVTDQTGCPTAADDLADAIGRLLERGARGWIHFRNGPPCSRYDQARTILATFGLPVDLCVPVTRTALPWKAQRPRYSVLHVGRYRAITGMTPRPWQDALAEMATLAGREFENYS